MDTFLKLGIMGYPIQHSLSPLLHAHLLQVTQHNGEYHQYEIQPEHLAVELNKLAEQNIRGLNVTIPHKVTVIPLLDQINPEAELAGAVNTIVFEDSGTRKIGYNTDIIGFIRSLPEAVKQQLPKSHILILGAGGSARAVMHALIQLNTASITFALRDAQKAVSMSWQADLIRAFYKSNTKTRIVSLFSLPDLTSFNGVINTTPIGMWPEHDQSLLTPNQLKTLPVDAFVYDLIYRPLETKLLKDAKALGLQTISGLDMLIHQGIASLELWLEESISPDVVAPLRAELVRAL